MTQPKTPLTSPPPRPSLHRTTTSRRPISHLARSGEISRRSSREIVRDDDDDQRWAWISDNVLLNSSGDRRVCRPNPKYSWKSSFITEIVYGLSITVVPFVPITVLNAAILRALVTRDRLTAGGRAPAEASSTGGGTAGSTVATGSGSRARYKTVEKRVRREFTVILLVICASVLCLSLPYFVVWCRQYLQSRHVII